MKRLLTIFLISAFTFISTHAIAETESNENPNSAWLYVIVGNSGKVIKTDEGYSLIINRNDISNMLFFAERPARLTKHAKTEDLKTTWKTGVHHFENNPPNGAVVISGNTQIVKFDSIHVTDNMVEFKIEPEGEAELTIMEPGPTVVFVDKYEKDPKKPTPPAQPA